MHTRNCIYGVNCLECTEYPACAKHELKECIHREVEAGLTRKQILRKYRRNKNIYQFLESNTNIFTESMMGIVPFWCLGE